MLDFVGSEKEKSNNSGLSSYSIVKGAKVIKHNLGIPFSSVLMYALHKQTKISKNVSLVVVDSIIFPISLLLKMNSSSVR